MRNLKKLDSIAKALNVQEKKTASTLYESMEVQQTKHKQLAELKSYQSEYLQAQSVSSSTELTMIRGMLLKIETVVQQETEQLLKLTGQINCLHTELTNLKSKQKGIAKIIEREKTIANAQLSLHEQLEVEAFINNTMA